MKPKPAVASTYQAPAGRPDLDENSKEAKLVAEEYNDRAVQVRDGARVKVRVRALPYPIRNPRPRTSPLP